MTENSTLSRAERERTELAERLEDPQLLDQAVEIQLSDDPDDTCLAVPIGGRRVAGQVTVEGCDQARRVVQALVSLPGFPCLRDGGFYGPSSDDDGDRPRTIKWGLRTGIRDDHGASLARMWGFHDAGVRAYVTEQTWRDWRVPVTPVPDFDKSISKPTEGRVYNFLLGGGEHYLVDREFVCSLGEGDMEALAVAAVINRAHLPTVVKVMADRGIDQYLDLGCGMPIRDVTARKGAPPYPVLHELAAQGRGAARVVYVDRDLSLFAKSRIWLEEDPRGPQWVSGDIQYMEQLLHSGRMQRVLDWSRPIGVLLHDVLPWIGDDGVVTEAMAVLRTELPPGSALSITHAADFGDEHKVSRLSEPFGAAGIDFKPRDAPAIGRLFGTWPLEMPGLVPPHRWHPEHPYADCEYHDAQAFAALAFKPEGSDRA
ncbi:DUF6302 family protein [Streptomyces misionensis]|uniref:DUF6302 family protein n=1 Tax=Streptomyces misionensis TaxID=67331 RepID=UPI0033BEAA92